MWYIVSSLKAFYTFGSIHLISKPTHLGSKGGLLKNKVKSRRPRKNRNLKLVYELDGTYREVEKEHFGLLLERLKIQEMADLDSPHTLLGREDERESSRSKSHGKS